MISLKYLLAVAIACIIFLLGLRKVFLIVIVYGESMLPNYKPGDRLLVLQYYPSRFVRKGDVVIAYIPNKVSLSLYKTQQYVIKRIAGMPGDRIELSPLENENSNTSFQHPQVWDIPDKHFFLLGDNLLGSADSRFYGPVLASLIRGKVIAKITIPE